MPLPPPRPKRVLVTGATGALGRFVVQALVKMGATVRAASRKPPPASPALHNPAVQWAEVDFARPDTFAAALVETDRLLLIAPPDPANTAAALLEAVQNSSVQRVVAVTTMAADLRRSDLSHFENMVAALQGPVAPVILRPNWAMQTFSSGLNARMIAHAGVLRAPAADAQASYIDLRDVAGAAAAALLRPKLAASSYTLTGGAALTLHEAAQHIGAACGREVRYIPVDDDEAPRLWAAEGLDVSQIETLLERYELMRRGFFASVKPHVVDLLGRPPVAFSRFVNDHLLAWRS